MATNAKKSDSATAISQEIIPTGTKFTALHASTRGEWLSQRLYSLTATDAAKTWISPTPGTFRDIRESKRNPKNIGQTRAFLHGREREPEIIATAAKVVHKNLVQNELLWSHTPDSRFAATPDGFGWEYVEVKNKKTGDMDEEPAFNGVLVECKTHNTRFGGKDYEELPVRAPRYFERDEEGIFRNVETNEPFDGHVPDLHIGQMMWQRVVAGGNIKSKNNATYYCVETHEDFNPETFELSILKFEFSDEELNDIIDSVNMFFDSDDQYKEAVAEIDEIIYAYGVASEFEKRWAVEKKRLQDRVREITGAGVEAMAYGSDAGKITASYSYRSKLNTNALEQEYPGLLDKFTEKVESDRPGLVITPTKATKAGISAQVEAAMEPATGLMKPASAPSVPATPTVEKKNPVRRKVK